MKIILSAFCLICCFSVSFAQETVEVMSKLSRKQTEVYNVLKSDMTTKQGLYQVRFDKNKALASGLYSNNKRAGMWHFFNAQGVLMQNFNYDTNTLTYEAPDNMIERFEYKFDKPFTAKDTVTKPMKIGGRYFGYMALLNLFKKPKEIETANTTYYTVKITLLVSPGGNLADYTIHFNGFYNNYDLNVNLDLLDQQDKSFIPATFNGEPVASTIVFYCRMQPNGTLILFSDVKRQSD